MQCHWIHWQPIVWFTIFTGTGRFKWKRIQKWEAKHEQLSKTGLINPSYTMGLCVCRVITLSSNSWDVLYPLGACWLGDFAKLLEQLCKNCSVPGVDEGDYVGKGSQQWIPAELPCTEGGMCLFQVQDRTSHGMPLAGPQCSHLPWVPC